MQAAACNLDKLPKEKRKSDKLKISIAKKAFFFPHNGHKLLVLPGVAYRYSSPFYKTVLSLYQ